MDNKLTTAEMAMLTDKKFEYLDSPTEALIKINSKTNLDKFLAEHEARLKREFALTRRQ